MEGRKSLISLVLFMVITYGFPWVLTNDYYLSILILSGITAIGVVGLNLLLGFAGQISIGHAAFFGISAYTSAILTTNYGFPVLAGVVCGVLLASTIALIIGIPALKLKALSLAMATLGFGLIVYIVLNETITLTGGPSGFVGIPRFNAFGYDFYSDLAYYYLVAGVLTMVIIISLNVINSRAGRALKAIHSSEKAAQVMGVNVQRYKLFVFVLSAVFAAVAGGLYAHYLSFVAPSSFDFHFSIKMIVMAVLGGMSSVWGGVIGALFLTSMPEFLRMYEELETILYGLILILCMMFMPHGLVGGMSRLAGYMSGKLFRGGVKDE
ncbi:branched-chain amino acid ABC transporter permease [Desulfonatronovibrio hydrogenovorans]|uniref:branched-chain amino acid ABC transporter permease n=1 Tax=Desulfonatronovibrio hydrogenovorans TaxID=53245 RepID=UPI000557C9AF|nr:branched-chain amino acid ABC transporter permease [Desulfonatronovibrio hydrogenovorans]